MLWRLGAVFQSERCSILLAASKELHGCNKPKIAEALTVCWAMELSASHGFQALEMETNCLMLVQAFCNIRELSPLDMLAMDIKSLALGFEFFSFSHVNHLVNQVAHYLAKNECDSNLQVYFFAFRDLLLHLTNANY